MAHLTFTGVIFKGIKLSPFVLSVARKCAKDTRSYLFDPMFQIGALER